MHVYFLFAVIFVASLLLGLYLVVGSSIGTLWKHEAYRISLSPNLDFFLVTIIFIYYFDNEAMSSEFDINLKIISFSSFCHNMKTAMQLKGNLRKTDRANSNSISAIYKIRITFWIVVIYMYLMSHFILWCKHSLFNRR